MGSEGGHGGSVTDCVIVESSIFQWLEHGLERGHCVFVTWIRRKCEIVNIPVARGWFGEYL